MQFRSIWREYYINADESFSVKNIYHVAIILSPSVGVKFYLSLLLEVSSDGFYSCEYFADLHCPIEYNNDSDSNFPRLSTGSPVSCEFSSESSENLNNQEIVIQD